MPNGHRLLDTPLLKLNHTDYFTLRDACQGVLITGGIGSGKTSGSGRALAMAMLKGGFGGLVLCAKPEEAALWREYARETGRQDSMVEWDGFNFAFNFISWELARQGEEGLNAVVECIMRILEISRNASAMPSRPGEAFWDDTMRQLLRHSMPILFAAFGTVRISDILAFVRSAPKTPAEMRNAEWQAASFFGQTFAMAAATIDDALGERMVSYWQHDFAMLDPKTRGNILISLTTALDRFNHGWMKDAFTGATTLVPELTLAGVVIVLNMPVLTRNEDGIIAQQLFKYMWQRAVLARNALPVRFQERPVFLWADEAQYFINSFDAEYLSTCRGSCACTVFLSQSLPTYYAKMAGDNSHDRVHHLLGNFATKIWHSQSCAETNEWAARTLGKRIHLRRNWSDGEGTNRSMGVNAGGGTNWGTSTQSGGNSSHGSNGSSNYGGSWSSGSSEGESDNWGHNRSSGYSSNSSQGCSEQVDWVLEPGAFSRGLKTGGPTHRNRVSAVWYQSGRTFRSTGSNAIIAEFVQ